MVGVGEEQAGLDPQDDDAGLVCVLGVARVSAHWPQCPAPARGGDVRLRRPVEQQQQRHDDADEQPGQRVEDEHAEHGGDRRR